MNSNAYLYGATAFHVGLSQTVQFSPPRGMNGGYLKIQAGTGTLAIVSGISAVVPNGYVLGATEVFKLEGPANFFLAAAGATITVGVAMAFSAGFSAYP